MKAKIIPPKKNIPGLVALFMDDEEFKLLQKRAKEMGLSVHDAVLRTIEDEIR